MNVMRYFKQSQLLRVAAADVTGHLPVMKVSDYLTWLAEAILHHVLESAWQDLVAKHGAPQCGGEDGLCGRGFAVIGYGKLGGIELGYGSDLDLVFIYGDKQAKQQTTGEKPVANEVFYTRLGQRIMHMLQTQMPSGVLYEVDMRLRPNGNSGLLTTSLSAYEGYQLNQAWTWEHQALTRARYIVGDELMHEAFEKTRTRVLAQPRDKAALKKEVVEMREKMRQALGKAGKGEFDVKQGKGGIADIEFIVQYLVLANAHEMPALLKWSDNIRILETAAEIGLISSEHQQQLTDAYRHLRIRTHRCALQGTKSTAPDSEFQPEREQVMNLWQYYLGKPVES